MLKVQHDITPATADRAIVWRVNEEDKSRLENLGLCYIPGIRNVRFERWNPESQFEDIKLFVEIVGLGLKGCHLISRMCMSLK